MPFFSPRLRRRAGKVSGKPPRRRTTPAAAQWGRGAHPGPIERNTDSLAGGSNARTRWRRGCRKKLVDLYLAKTVVGSVAWQSHRWRVLYKIITTLQTPSLYGREREGPACLAACSHPPTAENTKRGSAFRAPPSHLNYVMPPAQSPISRQPKRAEPDALAERAGWPTGALTPCRPEGWARCRCAPRSPGRGRKAPWRRRRTASCA